MKKITSGIFILIIGIALFSTSCKKHTDAVTPVTTSTPPNEFYTSQQNKKQVFTYNSTKDTVLQGSGGTSIAIGAGTLRTLSGQTVTGNVTIELKELNQFSDMILNNAPTLSQGKLFQSAGAFYISANQNGTPLTLAANTNYLIKIEAPKGTTDGMSILSGTDSAEVIVWKPIQKNTSASTARITGVNPNFWVDSLAFFGNTDWTIVKQTDSYVVSANSFGWLSTSFYTALPNECTLSFTMDAQYNSSYTRIYYAIPSMNAIGRTAMDSYLSTYFSQSIPDLTAIKIIGLTYSNNKYYICIQNYFVNCSTQQPIQLIFQEIAESDIETTLLSINI